MPAGPVNGEERLGEWFLFRELFHIPLLVRADTSLPLIGAPERTGSICCQNQIIFCQQSKGENRRLSQPCRHTYTCTSIHSYSSRFDQYKSLKRGPVVIYLFICWIMAVLGSELWLIWKCCWIKDNTLSAGVVPCSALTVSWQRGAQNHHKSIYGTLNQISSGGDSTFHHVALSRNKGLPATIKQVSERRYES